MPSNLIIRDDDLSFWTTVEEIDNLYKPLFQKKIKISFATIPFSVQMFNAGNFETFYQDEHSAMPIGENKAIIEYLKEKISDGLVEIMLHGYNHLYSFEYEGLIQTATKENLTPYREKHQNISFLGEYNYQSNEILEKKTKHGKEYLEDIFKVHITNFVPPSNQINKEGIHAIIKNNLHLSGLIGTNYNRELTLKGIWTYFDRILFALQNRGTTYPKMANYGKHKELTGYALTPSTNWTKYNKQFKYCLEHSIPFQIATHYWELDGQLKNDFYQFIEQALQKNMKSAFLNEVLK